MLIELKMENNYSDNTLYLVIMIQLFLIGNFYPIIICNWIEFVFSIWYSMKIIFYLSGIDKNHNKYTNRRGEFDNIGHFLTIEECLFVRIEENYSILIIISYYR